MPKLVINAISPHTEIYVGTSTRQVGYATGAFEEFVSPGEYIVQFGSGHETKFRLRVGEEDKRTHEKEIADTCQIV